MKKEKIKNYNQIILAILGTLGIIIIIFFSIRLVILVISESARNDYNEEETGILSNEKVETLQKENKRLQIISYRNPELIDTINSIYIIPVSHKNLDEPEDTGLLNLIETPNKNKSNDKRYSNQFYGEFNNLIIYNQKNGKNHKLFNKRVNFDQIHTEYFSDDILLLFEVAEKDTYKDGVINLLDFKSLYIYSIKEKILRKIKNEKMDVISYMFFNNSKNLIIRYGIDKNSNGKYDKSSEPTIIKKYDYQKDKLSDLIDKKTNQDIQELLEGTKK